MERIVVRKGSTPASVILEALELLKRKHVPINKKALARVTPYTRAQIAGLFDQDFGLETVFKEMRTSH